MKIIEIMRAAWSDITEDEAEYVLWERTPYPFSNSSREIYASTRRLKRAAENNIRLCDFCDNRTESGNKVYVCRSCARTLDNARTNLIADVPAVPHVRE